MRITEAEAELRRQLEAAGLDPEHLEPWEAWKVFKRFLLVPATAEDEGISVQAARGEREDGQSLVYVDWIRQFTAVEEGKDTPVRYVVIELAYRSEDLPLDRELELWSYDFPALADFMSHVEGLELFQRAMNVAPLSTEVTCEEI